MKRSQNFIALRELRDHIRIAELQDIEDDPSLYAFMRLVELFQEFELPVEHVGKICIRVDASFFESKAFSNEILVSLVQNAKNFYIMILDRVQDKRVASQILGDYLDQNAELDWYDYFSENTFDNDDEL